MSYRRSYAGSGIHLRHALVKVPLYRAGRPCAVPTVSRLQLNSSGEVGFILSLILPTTAQTRRTRPLYESVRRLQLPPDMQFRLASAFLARNPHPKLCIRSQLGGIVEFVSRRFYASAHITFDACDKNCWAAVVHCRIQ